VIIKNNNKQVYYKVVTTTFERNSKSGEELKVKTSTDVHEKIL